MQALIEKCKDFLFLVLGNAIYTYIATVVAILLFTQITKIVIKIATKHLNENARKKVNGTIILLPFLIAFGLVYCYERFYMGVEVSIVDMDYERIVKFGASAISLYEILERTIKNYGKKIGEVVADGQVTADELKSVAVLSKKQSKELKDLFKNKK